MNKRKIPQEKSRGNGIVKTIKPSMSGYNVLHEHNYFHIKNKNCRWFDKNQLNILNDQPEIIANDDDKCDSIPDWCIANSSSDEEDDTKVMSLSHILKIELEKDLICEVCPPLHWIHLIYLAIKNSPTENVTCYYIQRIVRCWFPYYCKKSYVKFIRVILSHINHNCQKYFHCNSYTIMIHQDDTWTVNNIYINILEESLMKIVQNNEDEIKSAMAHPDQLPTIVKGYGTRYLGCSQNSIKN